MATPHANTAKPVRKRILLVDDQLVERMGVARIINQQADLVVCAEANNEPHVLGLAGVCNPNIVVLEWMLEGQETVGLITHLRHQYPWLPILVLSSHAEAFAAERAVNAGARGYILKQDPPEKIIEAIHSVLKGDPYLGQPTAQMVSSRAQE